MNSSVSPVSRTLSGTGGSLASGSRSPRPYGAAGVGARVTGSTSIQYDGIADRRAAGRQGAGRQLERVAGGLVPPGAGAGRDAVIGGDDGAAPVQEEIGRASCREGGEGGVA